MTGIDEKPSLTERYAVASKSSDLTLDPNHRTAVDYVVAAGLSAASGYAARLGMALYALQAEWDSCEKPRKRTDAEIAARAMAFKDKRGKPDLKRARTEALTWHAAAMRERARTLRGREAVMGLLTGWAEVKGVDPDLLSPALHHFLNPLCPVCTGHGRIRRDDAPVFGATCYHCGGLGTWPRPMGAQAIHDHLARCLLVAKGGMGVRLKG